MPRLEAYAADGVTDYLMLPLPFLDTTRTAVHRLRDQGPRRVPGRRCRRCWMPPARMFSPWAERALLRKIALDLLEPPISAPRPVGGSMTARSSAATCIPSGPRSGFCDLRGFTAMSDRLPRAKLIKVLNLWFEAVGAAIAEGGGEILKFMGDGLLGRVPGRGRSGPTCERAARGGAGAHWRDQALAETSWWPTASSRCAVASRCIWGMSSSAISARSTRLDFTVIGPAVNMASRLEGLTKELGCRWSASAEFAAALTVPSASARPPQRCAGSPSWRPCTAWIRNRRICCRS